jgi:hypothetical protein
VQWLAVTPPTNSLITGYQVYIDDGLDGAFTVGYDGRSNPSQMSAVISGLAPRTTYRLHVVAINKAGIGQSSDDVSCYTVTVPGQPGTPELVTSTATSITVRWTPAYDDGGAPIADYELEMDEVEGLGFANV